LNEAVLGIMRDHNPYLNEIHIAIDTIQDYMDRLTQVEKRPVPFSERRNVKRMHELICIQFDDLDWKLKYPSVRAFMQQHPWLRLLWFGQILTNEETERVRQELETLLQQASVNQEAH
jgi:hypothetical protein